jgi:hypothetical protein
MSEALELAHTAYRPVSADDADEDEGTAASYGAISARTKPPPPQNDDGGRDATSLCIIIFCVLLSDMARGILFPTLWLLVKTLGGSTIIQGFTVAAFR